MTGPQGIQGVPGPEGPQGPKGDPGNIDNISSTHIVTALGYTPANDAGVIAHIGDTSVHVTLEEKTRFNAYKPGNTVGRAISPDNGSESVSSFLSNYPMMTQWQNLKDDALGLPGADATHWSSVHTIVPYTDTAEDVVAQIAYSIKGVFTVLLLVLIGLLLYGDRGTKLHLLETLLLLGNSSLLTQVTLTCT